MPPQVVFVQNSVHLAGAQKSLSRLLTAPAMQALHPVLLTGQEGWLTEHCTAHNVPWIRVPFPASRSLSGRLWGNRSFGRRAAQALRPFLIPDQPLIVHANDHPDSLLGLALAQALRATPVLTLRTPGMSRRDFDKYHCARHAHLIAVGDQLANKVRPWLDGSPLTLIHNGVTDGEILPPSPPPARLEHLLVLGSIIPRKGWQDLIEALRLIEASAPPIATLPEVHFLGDLLGQDPHSKLATESLKRFKLRFLGVSSQYRQLLRQYALAIHPSRDESFGMAALECVAAGVPLLAAHTGLIPAFIPNPTFLFPPADPQSLTTALQSLLNQPPSQIVEAFDVTQAQNIIRQRFSTTSTVSRLLELYSSRV